MIFGQQFSKVPTNKLAASGIAGSVTAIVVWAVKQWGSVDVPADIAVAISTVISFVAGYFTPPATRDFVAPPAPK
ncbi:MAG: hypothetical protein ACYDAE_21605 [Steroidobacteraceae bacterium]